MYRINKHYAIECLCQKATYNAVMIMMINMKMAIIIIIIITIIINEMGWACGAYG